MAVITVTVTGLRFEVLAGLISGVVDCRSGFVFQTNSVVLTFVRDIGNIEYFVKISDHIAVGVEFLLLD